jgi:predicted nucleic acid-binding protein
VRLVLDSGALTALATDRARLAEIHRRGLWPPLVPTVVLAESLTGDHRRDRAVDRLVALAEIVDVDESLARTAARLRTATSTARVSVIDAVVAATAVGTADAVVLTSDPRHLHALSAVSPNPFAVVTV